MHTLWLDLETFSDVPIAHGAHAYAERAEILLFAWAIDDEPAQVWDVTLGEDMPDALYGAMMTPSVLVCAHGSSFDRTILRHVIPEHCPLIPRWRDTLVKALAHSLPGGLDALCDILKVPTDKAKDKDGRQLVHLFCKPRPAGHALRRATRETHPAEWARFVEYARLDVEAMREVDRLLPSWNYDGDELALWHLDQAINDRGFQVDTDLAHAAIRAVKREQAALAARTQELTAGGVSSATQRDALLRHILAAYGVALPDMKQSTLERRVNDPDLPVALRELLAIRLQASSTSTSKYRALINAVSSDGRLRGTLQFNGASRTGRWAGRLFQPQNMPRGKIKAPDVLERGIDALKADIADLI